MSYLSCPDCGLTLFDRNPLVSPKHCPRCTRREGTLVELEPVSRRAGAAASLLTTMPPSDTLSTGDEQRRLGESSTNA